MSRYIDADFVVNECDEFDIADGLMRCISGATTPTIDIVRCKECVYYNGNEKYCSVDHFATENGFCSYGERKDNE